MVELKKLLLQMRKTKGVLANWSKINQDMGKSLKDQMRLLNMPSAHALSLLVEDNENAEKVIICHEQRQHLEKEIDSLEKGKQCT